MQTILALATICALATAMPAATAVPNIVELAESVPELSTLVVALKVC